MPIYEYYCATCDKQISIRFSSVRQASMQPAVCAECGGSSLTRLISTIAGAPARPRATRQGAAPAAGAPAESPQALAGAMQAASAGRDMGHDFREVAGRLAKGESATAVEASLRKRVGERMDPH